MSFALSVTDKTSLRSSRMQAEDPLLGRQILRPMQGDRAGSGQGCQETEVPAGKLRQLHQKRRNLSREDVL